jgi:protein involved in polysaccharide export with SLBB domain
MYLNRLNKISGMLLLAFSTTLVAQDRLNSARKLLESRDQQITQPVMLEHHPLDAPIDEASYLVGGGDRLTIQIETVPPLVFTLSVGVDGTVVLPTVGELAVGGRSLIDATRLIKDRTQGTHRLSGVSVSLTASRRIFVRVQGSAVIPQSIEATASDRVSTLLTNRAVLRTRVPILDDEEIKDLEPVEYARRSILLRRPDGKIFRVDLDRYFATGESRWNPHIAEGDEIIVNVFDNSYPSVAVGGAVWLPGRYEFVEGDRIADLIKFARGIHPRGVSDSVVLAGSGRRPRVISLAGEDTLRKLVAGDRLWIPSHVSLVQTNIARIEGEVRMPGEYPLLTGSTRLSEIVDMAGGLTDDALLNGATIFRTKTPVADHERNLLLAFRGNIAIDDTTYVRQEEELRLFGERVSVDFRSALNNPGSPDDPIIEPGDRVLVPRKTGTVYVFGQVTSPGHIAVIPGAGYEAYIDAAGGYTDRARSGDAVIIRYASRQWLDPDGTPVEEGDAIWVPKEIEQTFALEAMAYGQVASVLSAIATLILVIVQLTK